MEKKISTTNIQLGWCCRHCPGRGQCRATRVNRCRRTSSAWRSWWRRSPHPGPSTSWRSLQRSGSAALDASNWWDLDYTPLHTEIPHKIHIQAPPPSTLDDFLEVLCCVTWSSAGRGSCLTSPSPQLAALKSTTAAVSGIPVNRGAALTSLTCDSGKLADPFGAHGESSSPCPVNARSHQNLFTAPTLRKTFWRVYPPVRCNPELTLWGLDEDLGQAGVILW